MSRISENTGFTCEHCGKQVQPLTSGSYRNHCPFCLWSKHVDHLPGDRASPCRGLMQPIGLRVKSGKGYQLVHRCTRCAVISVNIIAEHGAQPDDFASLVALPYG